MIQLAKQVIDTLNATQKTSTSTYVRIGQVTGPSFEAPDNSTHFMGRINAGWQASVK
jgi:hypothetical protein